jgi:hypothetical protein
MNTFYHIIYLLWYATDQELLRYSVTFVKRKLRRRQITKIAENVYRGLTTHNVSFFLLYFSFRHFFSSSYPQIKTIITFLFGKREER